MTRADTLHRWLHVLVIPHGLRLADAEPGFFGDTEALMWDGAEVRDLDPASTQAALWDFVRSADGTLGELISCAGRWGVFVQTERDGTIPTGPGFTHISHWRDVARMARSTLVTMAATEAEELVPDEVLDQIERGDTVIEPEEQESMDAHSAGEISLEVHAARLVEVRHRRWQRERLAGRGLELQRRMVSTNLNHWSAPLPTEFSWDEGGRRNETVAIGLSEVVWAHLRTLFSSPQLDLYVCAVCERPFPYDPEASPRRPRSGTRSFCSEECRVAARRESNRQSWTRNSSKWRPPRRLDMQEDADGKTQS